MDQEWSNLSHYKALTHCENSGIPSTFVTPGHSKDVEIDKNVRHC